MTPYYERDGVAVYNADCRDALPGIDPANVGLVLTDPPYGVNERTDRKSKGRGNATEANDFAPVYGDDAPFDPAHLLVFPRAVLFGANYYADKLPTSAAWLIWDKRDGLTTSKRVIGFDDNADAELAWTNLRGPARIISHRWKGMLKASEQDEKRLHPTQKPIVLMAQIIEAFSKPGDLILDPYAGSGPTLIAAWLLGRRAIGIEIEEVYCEVIAKRLNKLPLPLFGGAPL